MRRREFITLLGGAAATWPQRLAERPMAKSAAGPSGNTDLLAFHPKSLSGANLRAVGTPMLFAALIEKSQLTRPRLHETKSHAPDFAQVERRGDFSKVP